MEVLEAMGTARAIRRFTSEPVSDALLERLIWAATRAPSPGNSQGWEFIVVTDNVVKAQLGELIGARMRNVRASMPPAAHASERLMLEGAVHLATHLHEAPAIVFVCGAPVYPPQAPQLSFVWSALYPAAQNLVLAARALGLGTTFTTFHMTAEAEVRSVLGVPDEVQLAAMIPIGWPAVPFGPVRRRPVAEVLHRNHWQPR